MCSRRRRYGRLRYQGLAYVILLLRIDTLCLEGIYPQKFMRFSQLIFGPKNLPPVEHNIVSFGLNSSSLMGKDGQISIIEGPLYGPKKCKYDSCSLALPHEGHCHYRINC